MEQTIGKAIWQEGWNKGNRETSRRILREFLVDRFGALSDEVRQRIDTCEDLERLTAAVKQAVRVKKLEDLRL